MKWRNTVCSSIIFAVATFFNAHTVTAGNAKGSSANYQSDEVFMSNAQAQLQLTADQYPKFEADHNSFTTQLAAIKKKYNNNMVLAKNDINKLIASTDKSIKTYLSGMQFGAYKKLYNTGQLGKNSTPAVNANVNTKPSSQTAGTSGNATKTSAVSTGTSAGINQSVSVTNLGIHALVDPFKDLLKLTPDQYIKLSADTKAYDAKLATMGGDASSKTAEVKALNDQYVQKFKTYLNTEQVNKFVLACTMQQNILTGKNLSADQKAIINSMRNTYHMNDGQIEMTVLIWTEAKIKLDIIQANASKDPQAALTATQKVLNDADTKMKNILTDEQYKGLHDAIVAQIKK